METEIVKIKDKEFKPYLTPAQINDIIEDLARRINRDYAGKNPLVRQFISIVLQEASEG